MQNHQSDVAKIQEQIDSLENLLGVLDDELIEQKITKLRAQQAAPGKSAHVEGDVNTQGGDLVERDKYEIHVYQGVYEGEKPKSRRQVEAIYRSVVASRGGNHKSAKSKFREGNRRCQRCCE